MKRSNIMVGAGLVAAAGLGLMVTATSASAADQHAASGYNGVCGSGYTVVNSTPIGSQGTVYLTYNSSTGRNCVVTQRATTGKALPMVAWVQAAKGGDPIKDAGNYTSYAGPVYLDAKGQCVNWGGTIDQQSVETDASNCGDLAKAAH